MSWHMYLHKWLSAIEAVNEYLAYIADQVCRQVRP